MGVKGIIQSRGLGDIIIALPIARWYHQEGDRIVWPVCSEFLGSVQSAAPWVEWVGMDTDPTGRFFLETPLRVLEERGVGSDDHLYLYQYLSSHPEETDPELYSILKFDQYKYWVSGVPFKEKWNLRSCITRNPEREKSLLDRLGLEEGQRYALSHTTGSSFEAKINVSWLDPAVRIIRTEDYQTDNIWDWLMVLEGAEAFIGIDSVFANLIDAWGFDMDLYWIRRSAWDLTPVLGSAWTIVPTELPIVRDFRVDPAAQAQEKNRKLSQYAGSEGALKAYSPFPPSGQIPTSFMHALKK